MKGQLSAEMLIMVVVVLAIVGIAATQLMGTAKDTSASIEKRTAALDELTSDSFKGKAGESCEIDNDCQTGLVCIAYRCG
ncbi:MAG: hypothetical protein AB1295_01290 [Candidatus Micrarchaeota archaeon]